MRSPPKMFCASMVAMAFGAGCKETGTIDTIAGIGGVMTQGGDGLPARDTGLYMPTAIAWSPEGRLVIDDFNNFKIRELADDGTLQTLAGLGAHGWAVVGSPVLETPLENPIDVAFLGADVLVAELHAARITRLPPGGTVAVFAGGRADLEGFDGDGGPATSALMGQPRGVSVAEDGVVYIADTDNNCIRRVRSDGIIERVAGAAELCGNGIDDDDDGAIDADDAECQGTLSPFVDGPGDMARFNSPERLRAVDGQIWVADTYNHAIRRINPATGDVVTVAGNGTSGFSGDGGAATDAQLATPTGVFPDLDGGFWIADAGNHRIRHVDADGVIETLVGSGTPEFSGDGGPAAAAGLQFPSDVLIDDVGDLYIADLRNGAIRKVTGAASLY